MALPGGPLEICFSFDTTASMTSYIDQVKGRLQSMVQRLQADIPGIRIALCAHGDHYQKYYDNKSPYVLIKLDFTEKVVDLCEFIQKADPTLGGDWDECYEYVLKEARETLSWSAHTNKVFVLIGDAKPHPLNDEDNIGNIDWKHEVDQFVKKGVTLYGTYCKTPKSTRPDQDFFKQLATKGNGSFLQIEDFEDIFDTLMAICYRERGPDALQLYEDEVKSRERAGPSREVNKVFTTLKKSVSNASSVSNSSLKLTTPKARRIARKAPIVNKTTGQARATAKGPPAKNAKPSVKNAKQLKGKKIPVKHVAQNTAKTVKKALKPRTTKSFRRSPDIQTKLRREIVPETNFILRELPWSSWRPAFCSKCLGNNWAKRRNGVGYRAKELFKKDRKGLAIYEFSVRPVIGSRKVVVFRYTSPTQTFSTRMDWFFQRRPAKARLNVVLEKDCLVYVRRVILGRGQVYRNAWDDLKLYSYLWDAGSQREFVAKDDVPM